MAAPWAAIFKSVSAKTNGLMSAMPTMLNEAFGPAQKEQRRQTKSDVKALKEGKAGFSDAQANQIQADALTQAANASQSSQDALGRMQAQQGGAPSGSYFQAQQNIAKGAQEAAAGAKMQSVDQSSQLAEAVRQRVAARAGVSYAKAQKHGQQISGNEAAAAGNTFGGGQSGGGGVKEMGDTIGKTGSKTAAIKS
jgi:hypothetical protein